MKNIKQTIRLPAMVACMLGYASLAGAAELNLPDDPLFLSGNVPPNVMFIQDDSGSMHREAMPDELGYIPLLSFPEKTQLRFGNYWAAYAFPRLVDGLYGGSTDKNNVSPDFGRNNIYGAIYRSAEHNAIFYNPNKTYQPWTQADGNLMPDANPYCAPHNPSIHPVGSFSCDSDPNTDDVNPEVARSLRHINRDPSYWWRGKEIVCDEYADKNNDGNSDAGASGKKEPEGVLLGCDTGAANGFDMYFRSGTDRFYPAYYTRFVDNGPGDYATSRLNPANYTHRYITSNGLVIFDSEDNRKVQASFTDTRDRKDCASTMVCTFQEEIQNFANWYSYHRSRILLARAGIGRAFGELDDGLRVGFGSLNSFTPPDEEVIVLPVRKFDAAGKQDFYNAMYSLEVPEGGTPLRLALQAAGEYYSDDSSTGPWADAAGNIKACRQSYTILMSDGVWNGLGPTLPGNGNIDGSDGPVITRSAGESYQYTPEPPFADTYDATLADVAMHYWSRDLLPNVENSVKPNSQDPAFWQHMTTFTVGLGVSGLLPFPDSLPALESGAQAWPDPQQNRVTRIDDLWHAAVNGRGKFLSASNGEAFAESLSDALQEIELRQASGGSVSANSGSVSTNTRIYQASFDTSDWSGNVKALPADSLCGSGGSQRLCGSEFWNAAAQLDAQNPITRNIISYDSASGDGFEFLDTEARVPFAPEIVNFLRGDRSQEGITQRTRGSVLGDVINASPVFEGVPSRIRYPLNWTDNLNGSASNPETPYISFMSARSGRTPMLFVPANDGMLHVLNANTGDELLGYIPGAVLPETGNLADPAYDHRFFVDATPATSDTFYGGSWHTTLVGGLGKGGQAVYALDVTGGAGFFDQTRANDISLWEFTHNDLGYLYGKPAIVRLHDGKWYAVFGNGYNNTEADGSPSGTGTASLFIVDIATGTQVTQIDTQAGSVANPNGISEVSPIDIDGDFITDYVYAGDLQGNMWKFDLTSGSPAGWKVGFGTSTAPEPLFVASDGSSPQPITAPAVVRQHPFGLDYGVLVYFGTGKYVEAGDASPNTSVTQSFYGIWDIDVLTLDGGIFNPPAVRNGYSRGDLQEQQILAELTAAGGNRVRVVTDNPSSMRHLDWLAGDIRGFYLDLVVAGSSNRGEMVISQPALRGDTVSFNTLTPDGDSCNAQPSSFFMVLDAATGGRLAVPPFDLNDDDEFNDQDMVDFNGVDVNVSGISNGKATTGSNIFLVNEKNDTALINRIDGEVDAVDVNRGERNGRRAWRELRRK